MRFSLSKPSKSSKVATKTGEIKRISDLIPDGNNANKGTERGSAMIEESLRKYGAGRSILIDKHGHVIAGNKTLEHAGSIGMEDVIVVQTDGSKIVAVQRMDLDLAKDAAAKGLAIADNRTSEVSLEWDSEVLAALNQEVDLSAFFSLDELAELTGTDGGGAEAPEAKLDQAEALRENWRTERDQIWLSPSLSAPGREHVLMCGDSCREDDVARLLGDGKPHLMVTDPPYGVDYEPDWRNEALGEANRATGKVRTTTGRTGAHSGPFSAATWLMFGRLAYMRPM